MKISISDIFWGFLMLSMLQPWLRQRMVEAARVRLMRRIERQRSSRLICDLSRGQRKDGHDGEQ
jgi:hypothetical protein